MQLHELARFISPLESISELLQLACLPWQNQRTLILALKLQSFLRETFAGTVSCKSHVYAHAFSFLALLEFWPVAVLCK
jgi:hypothetical protein